MNVFQWPAKFDDEVLDYEVDWNAELIDGETVTGEPVVVCSHGVTVETQATDNGITRLRLAGGTAVKSTIDLLATTSSGQKIGAQIELPIRQR